LCSVTVSNWRRNTLHDVFPLNVGGCTMLVPTPCARPSSALASTTSNRASICERVSLKVPCLLALDTSDPMAALSEIPLFVRRGPPLLSATLLVSFQLSPSVPSGDSASSG
jgi:hypothetical protein